VKPKGRDVRLVEVEEVIRRKAHTLLQQVQQGRASKIQALKDSRGLEVRYGHCFK
jgi:hypothetical protein